MTLAAEALDRAAYLRARIDADGPTVTLPNGAMREHPCLKGEIAAQSLAARHLARLQLDVQPTNRTGRPPAKTTLGWDAN
ncbi:MAG: hypothetical protein U1G05_00090 [Kiritimatiellia bacterium]